MLPGRSHQLESPERETTPGEKLVNRSIRVLFACSSIRRERVMLENRTLRDDAGIEIPPQINHQAPGDRDNPDFASDRPAAGEPLGVPPRQRALWLMDQPAPRNLDRHRANPLIAGLADSLFMIEEPASVGRPDHARDPADFAAIAELPPREELRHEEPRGLVADPAQL